MKEIKQSKTVKNSAVNALGTEDHRIFGEIRLRKTKVLRVTSKTWHGVTYVHVREWVNAEDGLIPTKAGCSFLPSEIGPLRKALKAAKTKLLR